MTTEELVREIADCIIDNDVYLDLDAGRTKKLISTWAIEQLKRVEVEDRKQCQPGSGKGRFCRGCDEGCSCDSETFSKEDNDEWRSRRDAIVREIESPEPSFTLQGDDEQSLILLDGSHSYMDGVCCAHKDCVIPKP